MGVPSLGGAVLAGGEGRRMGRPKSGLRVEGEPLLLRQLRLLRDAGVEERWVSLGTAGEAGVTLDPEVRVVRDEQSGQGPLAGIERVLAHAGTRWVLILAVDLPEMTADFLRRLVAGRLPGQGVVPRLAGRFEPLAAVYPQSALGEAVVRLGRGERSLQEFVGALVDSDRMAILEVEREQAGFFTNWNRPEDYPGRQ